MGDSGTLAERGEPKRWLTKKDGLRHLIHAGIRFVFAEEDPFATHVVVQSAEKVLIDLLNHSTVEDPFSFDGLLVPEHKKEFYEIYREPYNFLKHADKDHDGKLPVYGIVRSNDVILMGCIIRYQKLFASWTIHMQRFLTLCFVSYPHIVSWEELFQDSTVMAAFSELRKLTRGEMLETLRMSIAQDQAFLTERATDLTDVRDVNTEGAYRTS